MKKGDNTTFTDGFQDTNISIYLSIVNGDNICVTWNNVSFSKCDTNDAYQYSCQKDYQ